MNTTTLNRIDVEYEQPDKAAAGRGARQLKFIEPLGHARRLGEGDDAPAIIMQPGALALGATEVHRSTRGSPHERAEAPLEALRSPVARAGWKVTLRSKEALWPEGLTLAEK